MSYDSNQPNKPSTMTNATATSLPVKNQPLGYINSRLSEANVDAPFTKVSNTAYVLEPNSAARGNQEYIASKLTKIDVLEANQGQVICYERYACGFDTFAEKESADTAWITVEASTTVYLKLARLGNALVWVHLPNHKVEEAGGDPNKVTWGYYPKEGRYLLVY